MISSLSIARGRKIDNPSVNHCWTLAGASANFSVQLGCRSVSYKDPPPSVVGDPQSDLMSEIGKHHPCSLISDLEARDAKEPSCHSKIRGSYSAVSGLPWGQSYTALSRVAGL